MQEMKYFNEGNDCDICKNQLMTGRDGTVEDCRRRQNGLLESPDRVRVIKDGEEIYNQYFANMEVDKDIVAQIGDAEVKRFRAIPEITHRKYKERGLIAPMKPEETPDYSFRDLQLCIYHTITI